MSQVFFMELSLNRLFFRFSGVTNVVSPASTLLSTHEYATLSCSIPAEEDMFKWKVTGLGGGGGGGKGGACSSATRFIYFLLANFLKISFLELFNNSLYVDI